MVAGCRAQCQGRRRLVEVALDGAEAKEGTRCDWIGRGIVRVGHRQDRRRMGTVTSGDNNTIHRKVCMNHCRRAFDHERII